jgi:cell division protein FtsQ
MSRGTAWRRRLAAVALLAAALFAGYMLWLRDASWFEVTEVEVKGVTANRAAVTAALTDAARGMTTLHVRDDELARAAGRFPTIASVRADASLLHRLEITVTERLPVAEARIAGEIVAVSADGYLLAGLRVDRGELPSIETGRPDGALLDEEGAAQAAIAGSVPKELRDRLDSTSWDGDRGGVIVELEGAPELRFGDGDRAADKWRALAAVLAEPGIGSPAYIDVSVPERPVSA